MQIKCSNLDDFITNLRSAASVYNGVVYVNRTRTPLGVDNPRKATSFECWFQATAILVFDDGGQALLVCGENCGIDRRTSDASTEGSDGQARLTQVLCEACEERHLRVLPGVIDQ